MSSASFSFEFFPPKNDVQRRRFWRTYGALEALSPEFVSVTWGALGADSASSLEVLEPLLADTDVPVVAHLTCAGMDTGSMEARLDQLATLGISRILALRGDGGGQIGGEGGSMTHASDLVELIAARGGFEVSVAAYPDVHPEAVSPDSDLKWLARKADLGADQAITQFFFDAERFLRWRDAVNAFGIDIDIVPGILPVHDIDRVLAFATRCGAKVPEALVARFQRLSSVEDRQALAIEVAAELCRDLQREGIDAFHVYTLNRATLAIGLASALGVKRGNRHEAA